MGDQEQLARVLGNVLDNAVKYTPAGGSIYLATDVCDGWAELRVRDTGGGISAQALPHVFDPFYRADPSRNRRTGGSGLGLAIVHAIVQRHGGSVSIDSQLGTGTTVLVRLPRPS